MAQKSAYDLFVSSSIFILFVLLTLNVVSLIFELIQVENLDTYNLTFQHGYFILNSNQIGINVFANLFTFILLAFALSIYRVNRKNRSTLN